MDLITMESELWENEHCIDIFISLMRFRRPVPVTELAQKCGTLEQDITNFCHMSESPFCFIGTDVVSFSPFAQKFFNQYLERFYSSSFLEIYPVSVPFPQSPNHLSQDFPNSPNLMLSFCKDGTISLMPSFGHPSPSLNTPSPISIIKNEPSSSTLFQLFLKEGECLLHSPHSPFGSYHLGSRKRTLSGNEASSPLGAANKIRKLLLDATQEAITVENHQKDVQGLATAPCTTGQVKIREDHVHLDELQDVNSEQREDEPCTTGQVKTRKNHVNLDELQDVNSEKGEDADTKNCKQTKTRCLKKIICRALKSRKRKAKNRNQRPAQVPKLAVFPEKKNEPEDVHAAGQNQDDMVQVEQPDPGMSQKLVKKQFPVFEDYLVESEEGSGGYGTVYRARRKADGMTFAIKCPLAKTTRDLIDNEVKALRSLGGKHNVAKLEGVIEDNGQKAIVLEYIEHEKLELLKKDISLKELQAYGYCLFKALSHLHSKKIMHRDVKPGNFLFSRKKGGGYLVDFNLALEQDKELPHPRKPKVNSSNRSSICDKKESQDLLQKRDLKQIPIRTGNRIKVDSQMDLHNASARSSCTTLLNHSKMMKQIALEETGKMATPTGMPKRCSKGFTLNSSPSLKSGILVSSPCMQGSPMGGSPKEPLPKTGRRQLLDYVAKAVTSPQPQIACLPASQSKRVAAPQKKVAPYSKKIDRPKSSKKDSEFAQERRHEMFKRKGQKKQQKHGPCVGTKGYRAPEVLLRSLNQSVMVDIWSAGVTLLQLAAARSPFSSGCVEQAFKDIAKMRGSSGLVKLAKDHHRIQSLPQEIYGMDQPNITVEDWFIKNTRRPDLRSRLPPSFFDLIERCMQIDPAKRITAATATRHEFFAKVSTT